MRSILPALALAAATITSPASAFQFSVDESVPVRAYRPYWCEVSFKQFSHADTGDWTDSPCSQVAFSTDRTGNVKFGNSNGVFTFITEPLSGATRVRVLAVVAHPSNGQRAVVTVRPVADPTVNVCRMSAGAEGARVNCNAMLQMGTGGLMGIVAAAVLQ